jgi:hypothetical protein
MSTVDEIEAAISSLPPQDFDRIRDWLLERDNVRWDKQMEEDAASGRLDHLIQEIEADIASGNVKPLDEVINDS